ncbi:hypothetical protein B7494_g821 [Chlorociboria aeruginascens]|nr:hypothetical protein B7494_g821 [Chlorociboria aeruginascens]
MRRPPDKDGHQGMSERDVDSSNATLNAMFRGSRQKSWMTAPGAPVRPTPRAIISRPSDPPAALVQKAHTIPPSPAPSDEASPVVSRFAMNTISHDTNRRHIAISEVVDPNSITSQPSTGNETQNPSNTVCESTQAQAYERDSRREALLEILPPTDPDQLQSPVQLSDSPSSLTSHNPALPSSILLEQRPGAPTQTELQPLESPERSPPIPSSPSGSMSVNRPPPSTFLSQPQETQSRRDVARIYEESANGHPPSTVRNNLTLPVHQNQNPTQAYPYPCPGTSQASPGKRQRVQIPALPSLKPRVALINAHIESVGGTQNLNNALERPRFQLLTDACNCEDSFYVALHQLFCVWDTNHQEVTSIQGLPQPESLSLAFRILGQLIRDNNGLATNHQRWFSTFPSPLSDLMRTSEPYRRVILEVGIFLSRLASDWTTFSAHCVKRGYPPLVDELVTTLGLLSPILQGVVFTATRRNLGIVDDVFGAAMEKFFLQDRQDHRDLAARYNTGRPPSEKEVRERNNELIERYIKLHQQQRSRRSLPGLPPTQSPTPSLANNGNPQVVNGRTTPMMSQPGPDHTRWQNGAPVNPQFGSQQPQLPPTRRTAKSSPNPNLVSGQQVNMNSPNPNLIGRSSSVLGQQATPSPILMQGLSVNSPVQQNFQWPTPVLRSNAGQSRPQNVLLPNQSCRSFQLPSQIVAGPNLMNTNTTGQQTQQTQLQHQNLQQRAAYQQLQLATHHQYPQQQQGEQYNASQQEQHQHPQQQVHQILNLDRMAQLRHGSNPGRRSHQRTRSRNNTDVPNARQPTPNPNFHMQLQQAQLGSEVTRGEVANQVQQSQGKELLSRPLVPPYGFVHPQQQTNPDLTALHQAHIRSPRLVAFDASPGISNDEPSHRFYQAVKSFCLGPSKIPTGAALTTFEFVVPETEYPLIAKDKWQGTDRLPVREFKRGTLQYRLRSVKSKRDATKCPTPDWVISDTVWPDPIFVEVNNKMLEVRRKIHHGKDLPIDITRFILAPGGMNKINVAIPKVRKTPKDASYFIAVEVIEILQHQQIKDMCLKDQRIPEVETLAAIKKSLSGPFGDDDIAMVVSDLSIDLADPFTARIFDIPVRGRSCLHRECFDLETFLQTRNSKPRRPGQPCMIDVWKCPLCGKDARPYSLLIDDFLTSVRHALEKQHNLDIKAILVSADSSWRVKPQPEPSHKRKATKEPYDDFSSDEDGKGKQQAMVSMRNSAQPQQATEIIDLDD